MAIDAIINQKDTDVICIYVAIGQKASTVAQVYERLKEEGAMEYTIIVTAAAHEAAPIKSMAAFAGAAMAEHFLYNGKHALVIYDDLSKHADAYRQLSLLLRRPPGREAYPGDVFYLHSRLLERACKLNDELGGGSLTALPIVETQAGDIAGYIPTNVISITDGQIFLEADLFYSGHPAGDQRRHLGLARRWLGADEGHAEGGRPPRLELAQYRELEAFSQFGSELDQATQNTLARGERMVATLNQPQYKPWPHAEQVVALYAGINGHLDDIPVAQVPRFHDELREYLRADGAIYKSIDETKDLTDETTEKLDEELAKFKKSFNVEEDKGLVGLVASVQDLKRRVRSVKNTRKITKAMELVASARLRRAQTRIEAMRPYAETMRELIAGVGRASASVRGLPLLQQREEIKTVAVVALTGDRGLAGPFNAQIIRRAFALERQLRGEGKQARFIAVGKKGRSTLAFRGYEVLGEYTGLHGPARVRRRTGDRAPRRGALYRR